MNPPAKPAWVFGYGSLIWKQDFPILESQPAIIHGWVRRFWQGSHDHRGLEHDPGRVVTLIAAQGEVCGGRAFLVEPEVFKHLDHREKNGYERVAVNIEFDHSSVEGLFYRAPESNPAYLGPASIEEIARHVDRCAGPSGSNREYVVQLAQALRDHDYDDPHVFAIETTLKKIAKPGLTPG